jgi:hypothetical protein
MRTQGELLKDAVSRLDLIIKKMQEANEMWTKDLLLEIQEKDDEGLVRLSYRIRSGADTIKLYTTEFAKDVEDLCNVLVNSHSLFKEFGLLTKGAED